MDKFTDRDFLVANHLLSLENNAMLQVALHNQALIMQQLDISIGINPALMATLIPKFNPPDQNKGITEMLKLPGTIRQLISIQNSNEVFELKRIRDLIAKEGPDLGLDIDAATGYREPITKQ